MTVRHYDLVIVGSGSGNSILDERFRGWRVALVERGRFGGTCLNAGCIPTKMFVHTADVAATPAQAARFGVDETLNGVRWPDIRDRIFGRIDPISEGGHDYRAAHADNGNVTVYTGNAVFTGAKQLTITPNDGSGPETISADRIVLAAGGRPIVPDIPGLAGVPHHTSDTVMRLAEFPRRVIVLGSGFVGAEFAHIFGSLGAQVTLIARSGALLRSEDADISRRFTELAAERWDVRLDTKVLSAEPAAGPEGSTGVRLNVEGPDGSDAIEADVLLIAVGRRPNTDQLDVTASGLVTGPTGHLVVDEYQRTGVDGIWALGDISSAWELKHVANHEARVVQHNLLHPDAPIASDHRYVPHAVFTSPQIASVGLTEQQASDRGLTYVTATQHYSDIAYGWAMEDTTGFAKLIADPATGLLIGAHILGPQASSVIQPLIQAMSFGLDARAMARGQYWIHPAMPELVENALLKLPITG